MNAEDYTKEGFRHLKGKQYPEALEDFNHAVALAPDNAKTYFNRSLVYDAMGRSRERFDDLKRAIVLDPKNGLVQHNIGCFYANAGEFDQALVHLMAADRLGAPEAAQNLKIVHEMMADGHTQKTFKAFQRVVSFKDMAKIHRSYPLLREPNFIKKVELMVAQTPPGDRAAMEQ